MTKYDETDRKICACMKADPTITLARLAGHIDLTTTPTWKRVKRLEKDGVIARQIVIDETKLGSPVEACDSALRAREAAQHG